MCFFGDAASCWDGDDVTYSCAQDQVVGMAPATAATPIRFQKTFLPGRNVLPGDCMLGQLTAAGRAQQAANGFNALVECIRYEHQEAKNMVSQAEALGHRIVEESGSGKSRSTAPSGT